MHGTVLCSELKRIYNFYQQKTEVNFFLLSLFAIYHSIFKELLQTISQWRRTLASQTSWLGGCPTQCVEWKEGLWLKWEPGHTELLIFSSFSTAALLNHCLMVPNPPFSPLHSVVGPDFILIFSTTWMLLVLKCQCLEQLWPWQFTLHIEWRKKTA